MQKVSLMTDYTSSSVEINMKEHITIWFTFSYP